MVHFVNNIYLNLLNNPHDSVKHTLESEWRHTITNSLNVWILRVSLRTSLRGEKHMKVKLRMSRQVTLCLMSTH